MGFGLFGPVRSVPNPPGALPGTPQWHPRAGPCPGHGAKAADQRCGAVTEEKPRSPKGRKSIFEHLANCIKSFWGVYSCALLGSHFSVSFILLGIHSNTGSQETLARKQLSPPTWQKQERRGSAQTSKQEERCDHLRQHLPA